MQTRKIVLRQGYATLSNAALKLLDELESDWWFDEWGRENDYKRFEEALVKVIEQLGENASVRGKFEIMEIPVGKMFRIRRGDEFPTEWIEYADDIEWLTA